MAVSRAPTGKPSPDEPTSAFPQPERGPHEDIAVGNFVNEATIQLYRDGGVLELGAPQVDATGHPSTSGKRRDISSRFDANASAVNAIATAIVYLWLDGTAKQQAQGREHCEPHESFDWLIQTHAT